MSLCQAVLVLYIKYYNYSIHVGATAHGVWSG